MACAVRTLMVTRADGASEVAGSQVLPHFSFKIYRNARILIRSIDYLSELSLCYILWSSFIHFVKTEPKLHQKSKTGNGNMKCLRYNCYFAISEFIITELHHVCHLSSDVNQSEMPKKFSPLDTMRYRAISWERADLTTGAALL